MSNSSPIDLETLLLDPAGSVGKPFHYECEMRLPDDPASNALSEMASFLNGGKPDIITMDGTVIYCDENTAIVKVKHHFMEFDPYMFSFEETDSHYPGFADPNKNRFSQYAWVSLEDGYFITNYDDFPELLADETDGENGLPPELQQNILDVYDAFKKGTVDISIPFDELMVIRPDDALQSSINRVSRWFEETDCGIITAWRADNSRAENNSRNNALLNALREKRYGVIKVRGCYLETGQSDPSKENSFVVLRLDVGSKSGFYDSLFELSKKYQQDCFLYKEAGAMTPAYLIGTNEQWGMGRKEKIGLIRINEMSAEAYSEVGSGTISFSKGIKE